jgi:hypothetical protein
MMSELYALLERWRDTERNAEEDQASPTRAAVRSSVRGCIALLADRDERLLVADDGSGPTLAPEVVRRMVGLTDGEPQSIQSGDAAHWNQVISTWWDRRTARERMHVLGPEGTRVRVRLAARIVNLLAASPRHDRPLLARRASAARRTLGVPLGAGGERRLAMLAAESTADESWLQRLAELGAARTERARAGAVPLVALIVLVTAAAQRGGE